MGISVVLLAYKEAENLKVLLPKIKEQVGKCESDFEILIIDTAKPLDNTKEICDEYGAVYINQEEPYFGGAFRTGIKHATMDKFLIMDSDGSHNPEFIPDIYNVFSQGADVAIGSRYVSGGATEDPHSSRIMSWLLNTMYRLLLGIDAKDISTDFRMYHTGELKKVVLKCNNYDVLQEVLVNLKINKPDLVIKETPITFSKRIYGETKRRLLPFIFSYLKTLIKLTFIRLYNSNIIKQLVFYGIFGLIAAVVDFSVFSFVNGLAIVNNPVISNIVGSVTGFVLSFSLNTIFNFKKRDKLFRRFLSYLTICVFGMILSSTAIFLLQDFMNLSVLKVICIAVVAFIQFILNKTITFRNIP
jgi:dolichol-phosphate mannosyltransferase